MQSLNLYKNIYFWRTFARTEIDWIEERAGKLSAYEFKRKSKGIKAPKSWLKGYPTSSFMEINQDNYLDFICG